MKAVAKLIYKKRLIVGLIYKKKSKVDVLNFLLEDFVKSITHNLLINETSFFFP